MRRILVKLRKGEKGQALLLTMILLLVGSLIVVSLLIYMGGGIKVGKDVHEERMAELYAADAGVEDALWQIHEVERLKQLIEKVDGVTLPDDWMPEDYLEDDWPIPYEPINDMNGVNKVKVEIDYLPSSDGDEVTFNIKSVAKAKEDPADPKSTTIDAYVSGLNFDLLKNAITSKLKVTLKSDVYDGDVVYCSEIEPKDAQDHVHGDGEVVLNCEVDWPDDDLFSEIYLDQVLDDPDHEVNYGTPITLNSDQSIGPLYVDGDLTIKSVQDGVTLTLQGTVYVKGKLSIGETNKIFNLNLNGQTIFVEDPTIEKSHYAAIIGGQTKIGDPDITGSGTGCLIAVGNINFLPNMDQGTGEDFMFVFSIVGTTYSHPNGNFNGSFAGNVEVELQPGTPDSSLTWNDPSDNDLNFPMGGYWNDKFYAQIDAWEINLD